MGHSCRGCYQEGGMILIHLIGIVLPFLCLLTFSAQPKRSPFPPNNSKASLGLKANLPQATMMRNGAHLKTIYNEEITKSDTDKAKYRLIVLGNRMKALLVSDPYCDKASAAVDVGIGYFSDPDNIPGLAHFLEHLLFMGTEKYPSENEYSKFLNEHGGGSNAFTSENHTTYYFDINHAHLEPALDRFAQFFTSPLFNPSCTEREMQAVDSENKKNLLMDNWRLHQLDKTLSNPDHPYSHFGTGNIETLGNNPKAAGLDIRQVLIDFYKSHYSSNLMSVVVLGRESLDVLHGWVQEKFQSVPDVNLTSPTWSSLPWKESNYGTLTGVKTIKETRSVIISWLIPNYDDSQLGKPNKYYSHIIGDEGPGSILDVLKKKNWATGLSAGGSDEGNGYVIFEVQVELSEQGLENYQQVIKVILDYIEMQHRKGPSAEIYEESRQLNLLHFRFIDKQEVSSYAYKLARNVQRFKPEHVIVGPSLCLKYDKKQLEAFGNVLASGKFRVMLAAKDHPFYKGEWQKEKWYGTEYYIRSLEEVGISSIVSTAEINPDLSLPAPNEFIPNNFRILVKPAKAENFSLPNLVVNHPHLKMFHKIDDQYEIPKTNLNIFFRTPLTLSSPSNAVAFQLFVDLLKESLVSCSYPADLAGLDYHMSVLMDGLELILSGFTDKLQVLLEKIIVRMKLPDEFTQSVFELCKDTYEKYLINLDHESPFWATSYYIGGLQVERFWWKWHLLKALKTTTLDDVIRVAHAFFADCKIEALVHGNIEDVGSIERLLEGVITTKFVEEGQFKVTRAVKLPNNVSFVYQPAPCQDPNSATEVYLQISSLGDVRLRAISRLFVLMFNEAFFDILRTQEQLGYLVSCNLKERFNSVGLRFSVQSERDPIYLDKRIEAFISRLPSILEGMSQEEFEKIRSSLSHRLREPKPRLSLLTSIYWDQIVKEMYEFDRNDRDAEMIDSLTKPDMSKFIQEHVLAGALYRRKLAVHIWSQRIVEGSEDLYTSQLPEVNIVSNIDQFWASMELFPSRYSVQ